MTQKNASAIKAAPQVGFVSLGCAKALVDSERILTRLRAEGYGIAPEYQGADLVIVNTCGFLDSAREESLGAIGEALNENGKVVVTGCLGAEPEVIRERFPNVLAITGPQHYEAVMDAVHTALPATHNPHVDLLPPAGIKLTLRSTFIVGFPGETDADFEYLLDWMEEVELDRVGCFKYEDVKGATSNAHENHVPEEVKEERHARFMERAQEISARKLQRKIGTIQQAIVDEVNAEGIVARTKADAPEIDGVIVAPRKKGVKVGDIISLEVTDADAYDLYGVHAD